MATVIITGASKGIGAATALAFAKETKYRLLLVSRGLENLEKCASACLEAGAESVEICSVDLTLPKAPEIISEKLSDQKLAGIINNLGWYQPKEIEALTDDDIQKALETNLMAAFRLNQHFLPRLREQKSGFLFHTGSLAGYQGLQRSMAYSVAKHALTGYVRSLRLEVMDDNIAVSIVQPGNTWTSSWEGSGVDPERLIHADDVASIFVAMAKMTPQSVVEEIIINPAKGNL